MKTLIAYYSRTGHCQRAAMALAGELSADTFRIVDGRNRHGPIGFMRCVTDVGRAKLHPITPFEGDMGEYDLVILCAPVWASHLAAPARSFLHAYGNEIGRLSAVFLKKKPEAAFQECMRDAAQYSGKELHSQIFLTENEAGNDARLTQFAQKLYQSLGRLKIELLPRFYSLCTVDAREMQGEPARDTIIVSRTREEVQLVCPMGVIPKGAKSEHNWRLLSIKGPLAYAQAGIMKNVRAILERTGVPVVSIPGAAADRADYILVRSHMLEKAIDALRENYYDVGTIS